MKTRIIIQRHGQSMANVGHIYAGHADFELSELGRRQAELAADALAETRIDAIYSSDLLRASQTAEPHARRRNMDVRLSEKLREIYLGDWEASEQEELQTRYPYEAVYIWQNFFGLFRAPGGESAPGAAERFYREVLRIARENEGKTVLIASHAAVIRLFWGKISGIAPEDVARRIPFPHNASFSTVEFDGETLVPLEYSSTDHIKDLVSPALK